MNIFNFFINKFALIANLLTFKNGLIFAIKFALSVFVSYCLCFFYLDDILIRFSDSQIAFLLIRFLFTILVYIVLNWLLDKKISFAVMDVFFVSYVIFILVISLLGNRYTTVYNAVNFNILNLFQGPKLIIFLNTIAYIPLGYYLRERLTFKSVYILPCFIVYICLFETVQLVFKKGYFDINDIILNTLGFSFGIAIWHTLKSIKCLVVHHND